MWSDRGRIVGIDEGSVTGLVSRQNVTDCLTPDLIHSPKLSEEFSLISLSLVNSRQPIKPQPLSKIFRTHRLWGRKGH